MKRTALFLSALVVGISVALHGQASDQKLLAFEVAAIKPVGEVDPSLLAVLGGGCDGHAPRVDPHRFTVSTTAYALITWAYGFNQHGGCSFVSFGGFVAGGPDWIRSERFSIQALTPDGAPEYTFGQFMNGEAPQLEVMLKTLLAERFHLMIHRETKDVQGYTLVVGKNGPKIHPVTEREAREGPPQRTPAAGSRRVFVRTNMNYVALQLGVITKRPVVDHTGLMGQYLIDLDYAPDDAPPGESSAPSIFTAVEEQLGLKLEPAKVPAEIIVIDHVERPTPD